MSEDDDKSKILRLRAELGHKQAEINALKAERNGLAETLNDWGETYRKIIDNKCPPDEQHCTCVPTLRAEIELLRGALEKIANHRTVQGAYLRMPAIARAALGVKE
jgi:hypothetical protein